VADKIYRVGFAQPKERPDRVHFVNVMAQSVEEAQEKAEQSMLREFKLTDYWMFSDDDVDIQCERCGNNTVHVMTSAFSPELYRECTECQAKYTMEGARTC
jgi:excinuclease UvrABC ATPase subunit